MFDSYLGITKHKLVGVAEVRVVEDNGQEGIHHGGLSNEIYYSCLAQHNSNTF